MADLHETLTHLSSLEWSDVPHDGLAEFLHESFLAGELICNSVPPPADGEPFQSAQPQLDTPNSAHCAGDVLPSTTRSFSPHKDHCDLYKNWGKPYKFNKKDNPHGVALYKMAGHDRHGAWFARRSVHEGIGFCKFQKAMVAEFPHSLKVQGGPGAGAVRGIAVDRQIEKVEVDGMGTLEVLELSAAFPGPVTPRDFSALLMSTDSKGLTEKSSLKTDAGEIHTPRHFMVVSRPVKHPDVSERAGFVRGQYESVELIREIPLHRRKAGSSINGELSDTAEKSVDPELNPIEWIMITRSDPGGGIPRFLVERGTPEAMLGDMAKFLDWATASSTEDVDPPRSSSAPPTHHAQAETDQHDLESEAAPTPKATTEPPPAGIMSHVTRSLEAGIDAYAPMTVSDQVHHYLHPTPMNESDTSSSDSVSDDDSFMSADEVHRLSTAHEFLPPNESTDSINSRASTSSSLSRTDTKHLNHHDREVHKLIQQREKLDRRLAKKRADEEAKLKKAQEKEEHDQGKAQERHANQIKKTEEKHKRDVEKLEAKREKEARKADAKRLKRDEQHKLSLVTRERDEFRSQLDSYKRENRHLVDRVEELQQEVASLTEKLEKGGGDQAHEKSAASE